MTRRTFISENIKFVSVGGCFPETNASAMEEKIATVATIRGEAKLNPRYLC